MEHELEAQIQALPEAERSRRCHSAACILFENNMHPSSLTPEEWRLFSHQSPALQQETVAFFLEHGGEFPLPVLDLANNETSGDDDVSDDLEAMNRDSEGNEIFAEFYEDIEEFETCRKCGTVFNVEENIDEDCGWHGGQLQIDYDALAALQNAEFEEHGVQNPDFLDLYTLDHVKYPKVFRWTCCGQPGDESDGCRVTRHLGPSYDSDGEREEDDF